jgi:lysophospholipase L1-like esterase
MKANIKITAFVGIAFLSSFAILAVYLEMYSEGLLTTEKNILDVENIFDQNLKHVTIDVLRNFSGVSKADMININNLGFRGDEFSKIKPDRTYRIFVVGSSPVFGYGATSDETTIPGFMQKFLNEKDFGFDIEVINSGVQAVDSDRELELVKHRLITFSPDLIIIYDGWNDLRSNIPSNILKENWKAICEIGNENKFDTIISLQPIAGFGGKTLTKQESEYVKTGKSYSKKPLIESLPAYQNYAKSLSEIRTCTKTIDLRGIFDNEIETIYSDQGHVSDQGNAIVAKSLYSTILPVVLKNKEFNIFENEKEVENISSLSYEGREIVVSVELIPSNLPNNKKLKISTYDNSNNEYVQNVTYFLSISKNNENLLAEAFFAQDGFLIIDVQPNNWNVESIVIGEKQYAHNAYVTLGSKYEREIPGDNFTSVTPLQLIGPIFSSDGIYIFDIELRTIDDTNNWVYTLSDFHYEINFEKSK